MQIQMQGSKPPNQIRSNSNQYLADEEQEEKRRVSIIESTIRKQKIYFERIRGDRQETKQLNIHAKTVNEKYLKRCILANQLSSQDKEIYGKYKIMRPNFESTKFLYDSISEQTKDMCRQYSRSSQIVKDVLKSDRMFFNNKIIFVKFLKKMQSGIDEPNISWKQEYFKNRRKTQENSNIQVLPFDITTQKKGNDHSIPQQIQQQNQKLETEKAISQKKNDKILVEAEQDQTLKNETKTVRKKLFMKKITNPNTQSKQIRQIPAFGQSPFGGSFIFSVNNKKDA